MDPDGWQVQLAPGATASTPHLRLGITPVPQLWRPWNPSPSLTLWSVALWRLEAWLLTGSGSRDRARGGPGLLQNDWAAQS